MEKKIEDSKPILNRSRRQLLVGAALTPVVMTLHSAKVFADGTLQHGISGPAPFSGAIRGSDALESTGGTIETENALYTAIITSGNSSYADYYGSVGNSGTNPTNLAAFQNWTASDSNQYRWEYNTDTGRVNWTQRYEAMLVAPVDDYIMGHSANINTILSATWKTSAATTAYQAIYESAIANPKDWNDEEFVVYGTEGVRQYYKDMPAKLKYYAQQAYNALSDTEPPSDGD